MLHLYLLCVNKCELLYGKALPLIRLEWFINSPADFVIIDVEGPGAEEVSPGLGKVEKQRPTP